MTFKDIYSMDAGFWLPCCITLYALPIVLILMGGLLTALGDFFHWAFSEDEWPFCWEDIRTLSWGLIPLFLWPLMVIVTLGYCAWCENRWYKRRKRIQKRQALKTEFNNDSVEASKTV